MDMGIIASVKSRERAKILNQVIKIIPKREDMRAIGKKQKEGTTGIMY